jgi:hypothetical protein
MTTDFFELIDEPRPWHRQRAVSSTGKEVWEHPKAHAAFMLYCRLGEQRSVQRVARELSKSRTLISRWAQRWKWQERSKAYFDFLDEQEMAAFIGERQRMAQRQAQTAVLGQEVALAGLQRLQQELRRRGRRHQLTAYEAARLFEICSKIERICRGDPDEDQVASIHVTIQPQTRPRYEDAGWTDDAKPKLDS